MINRPTVIGRAEARDGASPETGPWQDHTQRERNGERGAGGDGAGT